MSATEPLSALGVEDVRRDLAVETGMVIPDHRVDDLRCAVRGCGTADDDCTLHHDEAAGPLQRIAEHLAVLESYFMRHPSQVDVLRTHVIPSMARRRPGTELRIWAAGCSTGEEALSLATLFAEAGLLGLTSILGTDLSESALHRAREARYGEWSFRAVDADFRKRWFTRVGRAWTPIADLRRHIQYRQHNLMAPPPAVAGDMDLIVCRNVLIYFTPAAATAVVESLARCLRPGGVLLLGPSDPVPGSVAGTDVERVGGVRLLRRPKDRVPTRERHQAPAVDPAPRVDPAPAPAAPPAPPDPADDATDPPAPLPDEWSDELIAATGSCSAARDAFVHVRECAERNGPAAAIEELEAVLPALRRRPELHGLHALLLLSCGRTDDAVRAARRAAYLDPSRHGAHALLGCALHAGGRPERGDAGLRRASNMADAESDDELHGREDRP